MSVIREHCKRKVSYFYDGNIANCYYGVSHPMKPFRIVIAHELIMKYGLYKKMKVYRPYNASDEDMMRFHSREYVSFLKSLNLGHISDDLKDVMDKYYVGTNENDCPVFKGLFSLSQISAGGSLSAATEIISGESDIAINWAGGLHHAKKSKASGFCYINDIVLCILELLKSYSRVLYLDIDCHHGDGVEEAFFTTDRVMTVSFHQFGDDFFPGTGDFTDVGVDAGKYYSINVPLKAGIVDKDYQNVFEPIMTKVMEVYDPKVIVMQCGADSLAGDKLGDFNLSLRGHGNCVKFMKKFNVPMILLGGGGYTVKNVSRCWCYETAVALGTEIPINLPENDFTNYFQPISRLHIRTERKINLNTTESIQKCIEHAHENLRNIQFRPSVQVLDTPSLLLTPPSPDGKPLSSYLTPSFITPLSSFLTPSTSFSTPSSSIFKSRSLVFTSSTSPIVISDDESPKTGDNLSVHQVNSENDFYDDYY